MTYAMTHSAKCPTCNKICETRQEDTFMTRFALPNFCKGCGERYPEWIIVREKFKRRPAKGIWGKIGFFKWDTVDTVEYRAPR